MGLFDAIRRRRATGGQQTRYPMLQDTLAPPAPQYGSPPGFAVIDVETTGLVAARDRVVEIAVISTDHRGRVVDEWATLVNPCGPVGATKIHGITSHDVRRAPRFVDILGELNARLSGRALVAHNARFDLEFIEIEYARAGWDMPAAPHLCTMHASWTYLPTLNRRRLIDCCWASGIRLDDAHSALGDARAASTLLASYLDLNFGRPPLHEHLHLPSHAAQVRWPAIPRIPVAVTQRRPSSPAPIPSDPGTLAALLDDLPLSAAVEQGAPEATTAYLELLAEVLEDGVLTDDEATSLAALAKTYSLARQQVHAAHRGFLLALAHKAIEDGKVSRDERDQLLATAALLGFTDTIVKDVLDEARATLATEKGKGCRPLPSSWAHGTPLCIGDGVAFTGCDDRLRARLEGQARAAGLRVTSSVSRRTAVLVTDGANPRTVKAQAARQFNTRTVRPDVFAELIHYVQPAQDPSANQSLTRAPAMQTPAAVAPPASGAAIRAWARQQGLPIAARGRIPADVADAYTAAHAAPADR